MQIVNIRTQPSTWWTISPAEVTIERRAIRLGETDTVSERNWQHKHGVTTEGNSHVVKEKLTPHSAKERLMIDLAYKIVLLSLG